MQLFTFNCSSQRLRRYSSGVIYAGSYPNTVFKFNFNTPDWVLVPVKTAVFSCRGKNYREQLDENNMCKVPKEVLVEGYFLTFVEGLDAPTNSVRIPVAKDPSGSQESPSIDNNGSVAGIHILDGGAIILSTPNNPSEDNKPEDTPDYSEEAGIVGDIVRDGIPFYIGLSGGDVSEVEYKTLNASTADYTEQGFYIAKDSNGKTTGAGYQITFRENEEEIAQTFAVCSYAKIIAAYQYQPAFNQWLDMGFDGSYWVEDGFITQIVNGKQITYTTYAYNAELMGDIITAAEYWRFEVEVL